ncbi:hypothetical protein DCAR_0208954 [Daucus carota subsp. sativus]|uniref:Pentacotripeptide-repeat region of PRORP domain-containing protein n=1 Tax=Daucus carota subsp. sativus TaxID=79200 RepID=A0AAF1ARI5_DAUCS|nr:hypothetical protein DCAR_0208954 [Daucus carota subsp. sativus]
MGFKGLSFVLFCILVFNNILEWSRLHTCLTGTLFSVLFEPTTETASAITLTIHKSYLHFHKPCLAHLSFSIGTNRIFVTKFFCCECVVKLIKKVGKQEHHLWSKRDSSGSGQKALNLVRIVSGLPNEKEAVYGALDKWTAWETEFPLIAAAKALQILKKRNQWTRVIQVAKWMLGKGQGMTMGTFDTLLLAFDMDGRVDEAESFWNMILHTHTRSISKRLFSRMIWLYDHHNKPDKVIEVFADMEELGVKPDEDTTKKIAHAFQKQGQEDKQKEVLKRYLGRWKYIHFNGERVRVKRALWNE